MGRQQNRQRVGRFEDGEYRGLALLLLRDYPLPVGISVDRIIRITHRRQLNKYAVTQIRRHIHRLPVTEIRRMNATRQRAPQTKFLRQFSCFDSGGHLPKRGNTTTSHLHHHCVTIEGGDNCRTAESHVPVPLLTVGVIVVAGTERLSYLTKNTIVTDIMVVCWYLAVDTLSTLLGSLFSFTSSCSSGVRTWSLTGYEPDLCCLAFGSAAEQNKNINHHQQGGAGNFLPFLRCLNSDYRSPSG